MSVGTFAFTFLFGSLFLGAMGTLTLKGIGFKGKCINCKFNPDPHGDLICSVIHEAPTLKRSLFCKDKI